MKLTSIATLVLVAMLSAKVPAQSGLAKNQYDDQQQSLAPSAVFQGVGVGPIPDTTGGPANWGTPLNITFPVNGILGQVKQVVVKVTMTHSWIGDLEMVLIAPGGQATHTVFSRVGATTPDAFGDNSNLAGTYTFADYSAPENLWTVATNAACGDGCVVTPQSYRATVPGPAANPAAVSIFQNTFAPILYVNGSWVLRIRDGAVGDTGSVTAASLTVETSISRAPFDFDGDDKTDIGIFRPAPAEWWINRSSSGSTFALQFGSPTDKIVPADFTGDGKTDIAVWRPSNGYWYILRSDDFSYYAFPFGTNGDVPVPAEYNGDIRDDPAVFRPSNSTWYVQASNSVTTIQQFGTSGDIPVQADYDGDGRADFAIFRPSVGQWWINRTALGVIAMTFGNSSDKPVPGDYTRDAKADVAFWRPSTGEWFVQRSDTSSYFSFPFGTVGDIPAPGDYDGDGYFDAAVFRPSSATWFIARTTAGTQILQFGANGDRPIANAFIP
jgi:hypothetical protein